MAHETTNARPHFLRRYGRPYRFGGSEADSFAPVAYDARLWQRSGFRTIDAGEPVSDDEYEAAIEEQERQSVATLIVWAVVFVAAILFSAAYPWGFAQ